MNTPRIRASHTTQVSLRELRESERARAREREKEFIRERHSHGQNRQGRWAKKKQKNVAYIK